jgi:DNA-directed RNA polymerase subunit RPC12/RpoP
MSVTRKALSKKVRFEVFKRDGFVCQYCGNHPPAVLLQVDHITPVKLGGTNDMDNLITSCQPCNAGKTATPLSVVPQSLADKAAEVADREEQIRGYNAVMAGRRERIEEEAWQVAEAMVPDARDGYPRDRFTSIKMFLTRLSFDEVYEASDIARSKVPYNKTAMFKYFCGVCWKKIKDAGDQ